MLLGSNTEELDGPSKAIGNCLSLRLLKRTPSIPAGCDIAITDSLNRVSTKYER